MPPRRDSSARDRRRQVVRVSVDGVSVLSRSSSGRLGALRYLLPWQAARYVTGRFTALSRRLDALEMRAEGTAAVYLGDNRLLVRSIVAGRKLVYCVQADDRLLTPWFAISGQYEVPLATYLARHLRADSHCIDVGANFGYFACLMGRFCPDGQVIAIEPEPVNVGLLRDNVAFNDLHNTRVVQAAVGDRPGTLTLHKRATRAGNTSVGAPDPGFLAAMGEAAAIPFEVPSVTLDDLARDLGGRVDFVKIDVEGWEVAALRGATALVAANPQVEILLEWSPGQMAGSGASAQEAIDVIRSMGLTARDLIENAGAVLSDADLLDGRYRTAIRLSGPRAASR